MNRLDGNRSGEQRLELTPRLAAARLSQLGRQRPNIPRSTQPEGSPSRRRGCQPAKVAEEEVQFYERTLRRCDGRSAPTAHLI